MATQYSGIRAVVFDLGKVLLDFDYKIAAAKIAARGRLQAAEIIECLMRTPLLLRYECGEINSDQFFDETCAVTGFSGTAGEFADCFGDIFVQIDPMVQLQQALKAEGISTYIFSNT